MIHTNSHFLRALIRRISDAESTIDATVYLMSPLAPTTTARHRAFHRAITTAATPERKCRAIFAQHNHLSLSAAQNHRAAQQLAACGWQIRHTRTIPLLHCKLWIIDNTSAFVGSHNLTDASLHANHELTIELNAHDDITALKAYYDHIWKHAYPWKP